MQSEDITEHRQVKMKLSEHERAREFTSSCDDTKLVFALTEMEAARGQSQSPELRATPSPLRNVPSLDATSSRGKSKSPEPKAAPSPRGTSKSPETTLSPSKSPGKDASPAASSRGKTKSPEPETTHVTLVKDTPLGVLAETPNKEQRTEEEDNDNDNHPCASLDLEITEALDASGVGGTVPRVASKDADTEPRLRRRGR